MKRSTIETLIGAAVLLVAANFLYTAYKTRGVSDVVNGYYVSARFDDVSGVSIGSDVRVAGVKVGVVDALVLDGETYQAKITLLVKSEVTLPEDSSAAIVGDGLLGSKFVAIEAGGSDDKLADGGEIEFTQSSVSLEQLIGKFMFSDGGVDSDKKDKK